MAKKPAEFTGWYAECPNNTVGHPRYAVRVDRGPKTMYFICVCGFRGFFKKGDAGPKLKLKEVMRRGLLIPQELGMHGGPPPPPPRRPRG